MMAVANNGVNELFQTQTYCLNMFQCLHGQAKATIPWFYQDFIFYAESLETITMITPVYTGYISTTAYSNCMI